MIFFFFFYQLNEIKDTRVHEKGLVRVLVNQMNISFESKSNKNNPDPLSPELNIKKIPQNSKN
jgi:hypothetical protein